MALTCVLFDHDDTLLPTFELRARVLAEATREVLGVAIDAAAFLAESHGRNLEQMSSDLADGDPDLADRVVTEYRRRYYLANTQGLAPYAGVEQVLTTLRARHVRVGVVTSKLGTGARQELTATGLAVHVEHLTGAEDVERHKPDPEPLRRAMAALDVTPGETLMVGDTRADILGARAAGAVSGAALWGTRDADALHAADPDHLLRSPAEILNLL